MHIFILMFRLLFFNLLLFLCLASEAQLMPFKNYGAKDGLNDNNVQAVIRDDKGLLWLGTDFGVTWFDGKSFYQPPVKTSVGQFYVTGFYKDWSGTIWVLTYFNGIFKYQHDRFTNYLVDPGLKNAVTNSISDMVQINQTEYVIISDGTPYLFDGKQFSLFDPANERLKKITNSVTLLSDNTILFSTNTGAFTYLSDKGRFNPSSHFFETQQVKKLLVTKDQLWMLTNKGVFAFKGSGKGAFAGTPESYLKNKLIKDIVPDKNGAVWALIDNGSLWMVSDTVFKIKNHLVTRYSTLNGLPENVQQVYCDNNGLVWFANRKGFSALADEYYEFSDIKENGIEQPVLCMIKDQKNVFWLGTFSSIAIRKRNGCVIRNQAGNQPVGYVFWLHENKNGSLYAGTSIGILNVNVNSLKKMFSVPASAIATDNEGKAWYGDINGKVWIDEGKVLRPVKIDHPLSEMIIGMYVQNNYLWVGYRETGVVKYNIGKDRLVRAEEYTTETGYHDMRIRSSAVDTKGNIIWGTRTNGVFIFKKGADSQVIHLNAQSGLNANWIKGIFGDTDGKLYLATNKGINIVCGDYKKPRIKQLKINDDNINRETNCIYKIGDVFYIGTNQGLLKWAPANMHKDTVPPPVYFTNINIQGLKSFSIMPYCPDAGRISLPYNQHTISFEFAGVSLKNPENVKYRYILEGENNDWASATEHNFVTYDLKPGSYTFKVIAENTDGFWSKRPAVFHFKIKPPFWQTWWFATIIFLVVVAAARSVYRYQLSKALAIEFLRNKISTDLHDDIGSTLSTISILSEVALNENEKKSKRILGEINERSHVLMDKMDDIVWSISARNDTVGSLFVRVQQFAASVFEAKDIEYEVTVPENIKELKLDMQRRQNIFLILKEALNNTIKYADCTLACINAECNGGLLKIEIADNGKGFDKATISYGNGLYNMQKRTEAMGGTILICSAPGKGTSVNLTVQIE